ncbi:hypothetical protein KY328_01755 [Candidatus Woesearchaeota archaeon]|nr:hypothetical protein [Candidatus Woesearchaeota archaeon]MBW3021622.1 hypothetical protein [Candidatus Woesearchaeota archaeon]
MKISIDTKEDSLEDIKRLINMLQNFVEHRQHSNTGFNDMFGNSNQSKTHETNTGGLFSMFGDSSAPSAEVKEEPKPVPRLRVIEY